MQYWRWNIVKIVSFRLYTLIKLALHLEAKQTWVNNWIRHLQVNIVYLFSSYVAYWKLFSQQILLCLLAFYFFLNIFLEIPTEGYQPKMQKHLQSLFKHIIKLVSLKHCIWNLRKPFWITGVTWRNDQFAPNNISLLSENLHGHCSLNWHQIGVRAYSI